ncbi:hypothetical protein BT69DRAFT_1320009 [Atractiella rhizophila]|nr:hypothetical protein BT69DRAFT_1320009 [Atractiella rhizophila]
MSPITQTDSLQCIQTYLKCPQSHKREELGESVLDKVPNLTGTLELLINLFCEHGPETELVVVKPQYLYYALSSHAFLISPLHPSTIGFEVNNDGDVSTVEISREKSVTGSNRLSDAVFLSLLRNFALRNQAVFEGQAVPAKTIYCNQPKTARATPVTPPPKFKIGKVQYPMDVSGSELWRPEQAVDGAPILEAVRKWRRL